MHVRHRDRHYFTPPMEERNEIMGSIWQRMHNLALEKLHNIEPDAYIELAGRLLKIILILVAAKIIYRIGRAIISGFFRRRTSARFHVSEKKVNTLSVLSQSILRYILYFIAGIMILEQLGVNTASLIATAGIGGVAIGFGAQSLVKDVITGFFILFEDQYAVGDRVTIDNITGMVEEIGLRTTKIRGFEGEVTIIPNGQILKVINHSRGNILAVVDVNIAYEEDINDAIRIMEDVARKYAAENENIVEEPQVLGVTNLGEYGITVRLIAKTANMQKWGVERELRKRIKEAFDDNKIEIPYPRMVIIRNNEKDAQ